MSTFGTCYTRRQGFCQRYDKFIRIGGCRLLARDDRNHRAKKLISGKVHDSFSGVKRRLVTRSSSMIVAAPATHVQLAGQRTARQVLHAATSNDIHSARADNSHDADVVVVGAGIGGLCCGAMLAYYGFSVTVVESHSIPGGAAHSFHRDGFIFDSGPSFHMGLSDRDDGNAPNALKVVLDLLGEPLPCAAYDGWTCYFPEGQFNVKANAEAYHAEIERVGGAEACEQFKKFERLAALPCNLEVMQGLRVHGSEEDLLLERYYRESC